MNQDFFWFCFLIANSPSLGWWWENSDPQKVLKNTNIQPSDPLPLIMPLCVNFLLTFTLFYGLMIHKKSLKKVLITSTTMTTIIIPRSGELESLPTTITTMRMNTIRISLSDKQFPVGFCLFYPSM